MEIRQLRAFALIAETRTFTAAALPLRPFTAQVLGVPTTPFDLRPDDPPEFPSFYAVPGPDGLHRAQRFAAYAIATDPASAETEGQKVKT